MTRPSSRGSAGDGAPHHVRIQDLPATDRPRERLHRDGPAALSNPELLAILLRTGARGESALAIASRLLAAHDGLAGLQRLAPRELAADRGLGPAKAAQIAAALELGRRVAALQPEDRITIRTPEDIVRLLGAELAALSQEELRVLLLNTKHHVLAVTVVYRGNVNSAQVRIAELLRDAVRQNAPAILLVHNHPSGDPSPSPDDIRMTRDAAQAAALLDIDLVDHVILGAGGRFTSIRASGALD